MTTETEDEPQEKKVSVENTEKSATVITVEHSLAVISDLISEIKAEDPPTQSQETPIVEEPPQTTYKHRFSLYEKNSSSPGIPAGQLKLFHSLAKSIKVSDHSSKILPIRSDLKIYPLSTTDQIINLEHVGITHYFKPYKRSQKTLAVDFYEQTKYNFDEFLSHQGIVTWLMQFGYSMVKSCCQTADMVRIGFLSRIRGFTLRDDFQDFIASSKEWKVNPFHFRIYFDAIGAKGRSAHVLMVDVDCPSID